jgi:hypothetical protein
MIADCAEPPLAPVMVTAEFPMYVELLYSAVSVNVELPRPDVVIDCGEKRAVTPAGRPLTESATVPLNPFDADTSIV